MWSNLKYFFVLDMFVVLIEKDLVVALLFVVKKPAEACREAEKAKSVEGLESKDAQN